MALRSQLVAEVCAALLAAGSTRGYTFHTTSDAPPAQAAALLGILILLKVPALGIGLLIGARGHLSICVLHLGNWERSRKRSTPQCFHHLINWEGTWQEHKRDPTCRNLFLHFLSNISSHVLILQEASSIRHLEKTVMERRLRLKLGTALPVLARRTPAASQARCKLAIGLQACRPAVLQTPSSLTCAVVRCGAAAWLSARTVAVAARGAPVGARAGQFLVCPAQDG